MEILEKIKSKIESINSQREQLVSELRKDFAPMLAPIFEKSGGIIKSVGWTQYTPYFNDGDECVFSAHNDDVGSFILNGEQVDDSGVFTVCTYSISRYISNNGSYERWIEKYPEDAFDPKQKSEEVETYRLLMELTEILSEIDDEFYKDLFGDHVLVTVCADGTISTEEYEHD